MLPSGAVFFILIVAVVLASALAWLLAALYERRMLTLMRGGAAPAGSAAPQPAGAPASPRASAAGWGPQVDLAANRRAATRLMIVLAAICLLIALTQALLALHFVYTDRAFSVQRLLLLGAVYAWPMVLAWGLARRWSWPRIVAGIAVYMAAMLILVLLRSTAAQTVFGVGGWLFSQVVVPLTITLLIGASGRIRAVAPYLLPPVLLLSGASVLSLQVAMPNSELLAPWLVTLVGALGAWPTLLLFVFAPWLVLAWPVWRLGKWLAAAYRAKRFSDLGYLLAVYWFLILFASALPAMESVGAVAFVELLAWFWLPLLLHGLRAALAPPPEPPTLLVLRVFQHDRQVERLFDEVIERWRLTGNTVLIAGTDLLSRTLDPDDLFVYLNGALGERFIANADQIAARIEAFDARPDPDGRYRINECYCFDNSWQAALDVLVARCSVVLMDLRGFHAGNRGCRYELGVLARATHLRRVVVLHDRATARGVADVEIAAAPRLFHWLPAERLDRAAAGRTLAALFGAVS